MNRKGEEGEKGCMKQCPFPSFRAFAVSFFYPCFCIKTALYFSEFKFLRRVVYAI
jgi:hypothetical protein